MKTKRAAGVAILLFVAVAVNVAADKPETPPPGIGVYIMTLWPPGAPVPGDPNGTVKKHPEPDIEKVGGRHLDKKDHRHLIMLPLAAAKQLRKNEAVVTLQRVWMGESVEGWDETAAASEVRRLTPRALSDTDLQWGPKEPLHRSRDASSDAAGVRRKS